MGTQFSMFSFKGCVNFVECHFVQVLFNLSGFIRWTHSTEFPFLKAKKLLKDVWFLLGVFCMSTDGTLVVFWTFGIP